jgi:hypothetical protein
LQVANALQKAYEERLEVQIEAKVLRRFGFTAKSFRDEGKKKCMASLYNGLCAKIAGVRLSLKFLLAGFDDKNKGRIIVGGGEEAPTDYTRLGFWAIGSGAEAALSSLVYHRERQHIATHISVEQCTYVVAAAKFMAESARDVGQSTNVCIVAMPSELKVVLSEYPLRKIWENEGAPRLPKNLDARVGPLIMTPEKSREKSQEAVDPFTRLESQKSEGQQ